jgi:hypothetical protein
MKILFTLIFIFSCFLTAQSQTPDDYFHSASNSYILGNIDDAKRSLNEGLAKYPKDEKLNKLARKIKDDENKQKQQQEDQNQEQKEDKKDQQQQQQEEQQNQMKRQDAERLLNAMQQDEDDLQKEKRKVKATQRATIEKNW